MTNHIVELCLAVIPMGLIYALVTLGVYATSRIIKFDDLTCEGSFGFGGAIGAWCLIQGFTSPTACVASLMAGMMLGGITALIHQKLQVNHLVSGLVVTTASFSLALLIGGAATPLPVHTQPMTSLLVIVVVVYALAYQLLRSEIGLLIRALGENPAALTAIGRRPVFYQTVTLMGANALHALAGSLFVQLTGFFSVTSNVGTLVMGLSCMMLGEMLSVKHVWVFLIGAILYQFVFALILELEINPQLTNLLKGAMLVALVQLSRILTNRRTKCFA